MNSPRASPTGTEHNPRKRGRTACTRCKSRKQKVRYCTTRVDTQLISPWLMISSVTMSILIAQIAGRPVLSVTNLQSALKATTIRGTYTSYKQHICILTISIDTLGLLKSVLHF